MYIPIIKCLTQHLFIKIHTQLHVSAMLSSRQYYVFFRVIIRGHIQKFPNGVNNAIYTYLCCWSSLSALRWSCSEFKQWLKHFWHCWRHCCNWRFGIVCSTVSDLTKFWGQLGNDALVAVISFSERRTIHKRSNWAHKEGGDHSHVLFTKYWSNSCS